MKYWTAFLMLLLTVTAQAQTQTPEKTVWEKVASNDTMTIYINLASYSSKGNVATIWLLEDFAKSAANASGQPYQSIKKLVSFDCPERTFTTKYQIVHTSTMGKGSLVTEGDVRQTTNPVPPGTEIETVYKWVCR